MRQYIYRSFDKVQEKVNVTLYCSVNLCSASHTDIITIGNSHQHHHFSTLCIDLYQKFISPKFWKWQHDHLFRPVPAREAVFRTVDATPWCPGSWSWWAGLARSCSQASAPGSSAPRRRSAGRQLWQLVQLGQLVGVSSGWRGPGCRCADECWGRPHAAPARTEASACLQLSQLPVPGPDSHIHPDRR